MYSTYIVEIWRNNLEKVAFLAIVWTRQLKEKKKSYHAGNTVRTLPR